MKAAILSVAVVAGLAFTSGTASAQWRGGGNYNHGAHYHPGQFHNGHYHSGYWHSNRFEQQSYARPIVVTPYNAGLFGVSPYSGVYRPATNFNYGFGVSAFGNPYNGRGYGRRW